MQEPAAGRVPMAAGWTAFAVACLLVTADVVLREDGPAPFGEDAVLAIGFTGLGALVLSRQPRNRAGLLCLTPLLAAVAYTAGVAPQTDPPLPDTGRSQVGTLLTTMIAPSGLAVVAWLLARRQPRHGLLPLLLLPPLVTAAQYSQQIWILRADRYHLGGLAPAQWMSYWIWLAGPAALTVLLLRFPTGRPLSPRWRRYEIVVLLHFGVVAALFAALPLMPEAPPGYHVNPLGVEALRPVGEAVVVLAYLTGLHIVAGALALAVRYRRSDQLERQQLRWMAVAGSVLVLTTAATAFGVPWILDGIGIAVFAAAIGVTVLRYRLWDLGLVLRRTALYAVLTALLVACYVGLVLTVRAVITVGLLLELLVTTLIAIIALPLRGVLQHGMDRMLFGNRRDPVAVVRALGLRLQDGAGPVLPSVVEELGTALRLPGVAVLLPDGSVAAAHGEIPVEGARLTLHHRGVAVGELVAARRHPREPLTGHDLRLLADLAGQLGVAVRSAVLDEAVRRSRDRLLAVRDGERARLRRDLHDELGPLLSGASLRAMAVRNLLAEPAPRLDRAGIALTAVSSDLQRALDEVQRILAGLRPSVLAERGLLDALREHAASWAGELTLRLDLPELLPALDPAVEAAAYRIAVEGLHNAERHSGRSTVTVRITVRGGDIEVDVIDDGAGLVDSPASGVGLGSMRERARLVGGSLRLEQGETGGLRVCGVLPAGVR